MRVLHLIHTTHVGGVEMAAAHLRQQLDGATGQPLAYRVAAFEAAPEQGAALTADIVAGSLNSPLSWMRLLGTLRRAPHDILITSLWRSMALAGIGRALGRRTPWAVWVHNSRFTNPIDRLVHRWTLPRADVILADSVAARDELVQPLLRRAKATTPIMLVRPDAPQLPLLMRTPPSPQDPLRLVSWGRIAPQKRLPAVIDVLAELNERWPGGASLDLLGPDGGALTAVRERIEDHGLVEQVTIHGPANREQIASIAHRAHVFVQLSQFEGYAMSAHEALAAGMICLLTPVGDLAADTRDGYEALHHHGDARDSAERLVRLAGDAGRWVRMSQRAREARSTSMLEEFTRACRALAASAAPTTEVHAA